MPAPTAAESELELHFAAYDEILQAVLGKLPLDGAARAARLERARQHLRGTVRHTEDFLGQLGGCASALGVKEAAFTTFVGANFLKALQLARRRAAEAARAPAADAGRPQAGKQPAAGQAAQKKYTSLMAEIVETFGPIISGGRFVPLDDGMLKFVGPSGEVLPASYGTPGVDSGPEAPSPEAAPQAAAAVPAAGARPAPARPAPAPAPRVAEKPIIKEILEKLGSVLDIHGKLEPSTGLEGQVADADDEDESDAPETAEPNGNGGAAAVAVPAGRITSARAPVAPPEKPIIAEILEKLGSSLDVHQKLVPTSGIEPGGFDEGEADDEEGEAGEGDAGESGVAEMGQDLGVAFEPLPLDFEAYMKTLRRLQEYQAAGHEADYRRWLTSEASASEKALVGLRNLEARARDGSVDWNAQYRNLSTHMDGVSPDQLAHFHQRLRGFHQIHQLVGRVKAAMQGKPPALVNAMRSIWPNLLLLLNEDTDVSGYQSEFRIALLAVPDPAVRSQLENFLRPVFEKLAGIYAAMRS